jgi:hypothetical protein
MEDFQHANQYAVIEMQDQLASGLNRSPTVSLDILCAAPANARNLRGCLTALESQWNGQADGIALVVTHAGAVPQTIAQEFPRVRWIECDVGATLPDLWGRAIADTKGEMIALLDGDCPVADDWLNAALALAAQVHDLVGGAVEPRGLKTSAAWAAYFCDYGAFLPPMMPGAAREIAGDNLIVRRALLAHAPEFVQPRFWKAYFVHALATRGIVGWNTPTLVINYAKNYAAREWLARRFRHARCFGAMRFANKPALRRIGFGALAPLVPAILFARVARNVLPKRRFLHEFVSALPMIVAGVTAWGVGEWVGAWFGADRACEEIV